jgi:hypothetical protein
VLTTVKDGLQVLVVRKRSRDAILDGGWRGVLLAAGRTKKRSSLRSNKETKDSRNIN